MKTSVHRFRCHTFYRRKALLFLFLLLFFFFPFSSLVFVSVSVFLAIHHFQYFNPFAQSVSFLFVSSSFFFSLSFCLECGVFRVSIEIIMIILWNRHRMFKYARFLLMAFPEQMYWYVQHWAEHQICPEYWFRSVGQITVYSFGVCSVFTLQQLDSNGLFHFFTIFFLSRCSQNYNIPIRNIRNSLSRLKIIIIIIA